MSQRMSDQPGPTIKLQRDLKHEMKEQRRQAAARGERTKTIVTWSVVGLVIAGVIALIIASGTGTGSSNAAVATITSQDNIKGSATAKAVVIEYSDFQCPACKAYYPIMKNLEQKYGDKLALVYRYYPLTQIHKNADIASRAGAAAALQGKFWEMHDLLFEGQGSWGTLGSAKQAMIDYAKELKLDEAKFTSDLDSSTVKDRVNVDVTSGNAVAIQGTPTFYLNEKKLANPGTENAFSQLIDSAIAGT